MGSDEPSRFSADGEGPLCPSETHAWVLTRGDASTLWPRSGPFGRGRYGTLWGITTGEPLLVTIDGEKLTRHDDEEMPGGIASFDGLVSFDGSVQVVHEVVSSG